MGDTRCHSDVAVAADVVVVEQQVVVHPLQRRVLQLKVSRAAQAT